MAIFSNKKNVTVTNTMGISAVVFTPDEWAKVESMLIGLTGEELLDIQHLVRYPPKKTMIERNK